MFFITQIYGKGVRRGGHAIGSNGRYNVFANGEHEEHEIFSLVNRFVFANGEHEEHEVFSLVNRFVFANGEHEEHESFYLVNRLHRLHRKLTSCASCYPLAKEKKSV